MTQKEKMQQLANAMASAMASLAEVFVAALAHHDIATRGEMVSRIHGLIDRERAGMRLIGDEPPYAAFHGDVAAKHSLLESVANTLAQGEQHVPRSKVN